MKKLSKPLAISIFTGTLIMSMLVVILVTASGCEVSKRVWDNTKETVRGVTG
jgi:hypothetical protein